MLRSAAAIALAAISVLAGGPEPRTVLLLFLAAVTPQLAAIDVREQRLPNRLVLPGYPVAACALAGEWLRSGTLPAGPLIAGAAAFALLLVPAVFGGMGMGDVKLAGVLGLAAGSLGLGAAVGWLPIALLLGGVASLFALRRARGTSIPFGPALLAGFWIAVALSPAASWT